MPKDQPAAPTASRLPLLLEPYAMRSVTLRNRIVLSPMCQYSAEDDGVPHDWHVQHLGARAAGGAGLVFTEATAVEPEGRITRGDLGLWSDAQEAGFARLARLITGLGGVPAVQLAHAGRKASVTAPWLGDRPVPVAEGGWVPQGPSALPHAPASTVPRVMGQADVDRVAAAFAASATRALRVGVKLVEIHAAHGYLLHSFLSLLSNPDGGNLAARARPLLQVVEAVRQVWPDELPLMVRLSCTDWAEGGLTLEDSIEVARMLAATGGVDLIDCSSGGVVPALQRIPSLHPGYQVPFAQAIRREAGIATGAVGAISTPEHAAEILGNGRADLVFVGRAMLADPAWPLRAYRALGAPAPLPSQYLRAK